MKELIYHRGFLPAVARFGEKTAVIDGAYEATFTQHADRVFRLAHALKHQLGINRPDRFAVMAVNSHEYLELYHAAYLGAGVINPLNLRLAGKELDYIVRDSGSQVIFVDQHFAQMFHDAMRAGDGANAVRKVVLLGPGDGPCDIRYEDLLASASPDIPSEPEEDDPVVLMYTGGTTGLPKGVLSTQRAQILNCYHCGMMLGAFNSEGVSIIQTPIFHAASMVGLLAITAAGGTQVLIPMFDPAGVIALIKKHKVTQSTMVPTMIGMMLNHPDFAPGKIASLKSLIYGASPMPPTLLDRLAKVSPDLELTQGYGMTESSSLLTFLTARDHEKGGRRLRSVGSPVPGVEISIQDEQGKILASGETGEVCAKGGNFMNEYWNKPEATEEAFKDGWYHTGDAGYLDDEGYLFLVDRVKDMIITGGENVYSAEVENAISSHPAVEQVAVIGIPNEQWGEAVHAVVVLSAEAVATEDELIVHARASIAGYKVPKSIEFRQEPLPLSGAMKVLKRELRAPHWEGREKSIG
jgi:long-chain acyl-CoA synthetase